MGGQTNLCNMARMGIANAEGAIQEAVASFARADGSSPALAISASMWWVPQHGC